jgi:regulator of replication initiation timing
LTIAATSWKIVNHENSILYSGCLPVLVLCPSCNKDIENFREEIKVLKDENNFLKAENIALKKEIEELYRGSKKRTSQNKNRKQKVTKRTFQKKTQ